MKRKIFLTLLITLALVSIFAFAVSAEAYDANRTAVIYTDENGNLHNVPIVTYDDATVSLVASKNGASENMLQYFKDDNAFAVLMDKNGNLTAYPTWYFIQPSGTNPNYIAISEIVYGYVNHKLGGTVYENALTNSSSNGSMVYCEFPHGMTALRANSVFGKNGAQKEKILIEIHVPSTVKSIESLSFQNAPSLRRVYFEKGNGITTIQGSTFSDSKNIEYIQFENLYLTSIDGVSNLGLKGPVDLSHMPLTSLPSNIFTGCSGITEISLPDTIETIGAGAFSGCTNGYLATPYLPSSLKTIGNQFFYNAKNFNNLLIFPEGFESIGNEAFQDMVVKGGAEGNEFNLVFLGKMNSVVYLNGNGHQKHAEKVTVYFAQNSLSEYNKNGFYIKPSGSSVTSVPGAIRAAFCAGTGAGTNGSVTGVEYVYITNVDGTSFTSDYVNHADYGFDFDNHTHYGAKLYREETCGKEGFEGVSCIVCDTQIGEIVPATGNHTTEDDGNCETEVICSVCQNVVIEAISHVLGEVYSYDKGYLETGTFKIGCTNKGCTHGETTEIPALAISKGFSQEIGENTGAIVFGIIFNREAIEAYEKYLNTTIDFGLIASSVQDESPLNSDASAKTGTIKSSFAEAKYSIFQIKLNGIEKEQYAQLFHCGGYFLVDGEISYVNNKSIGSTSTLVSYNIVTTLVEKKD